jgi:thiamine pyrophosphokinase
MKIGICASGPSSEMMLPEVDYLIGVDRGASTLLAKGYMPHEMIGDFDSVTEEEFNQLTKVIPKFERVSSHKDETDTDLALMRAIQHAPSEVFVTCVTGGRLDHQEAVFRSVQRFQLENPAISFQVINKQNAIQYLLPGTHQLRSDSFKYVSFFALSETIFEVTLKGVKYETNKVRMEPTSTLFTSNEIIEDKASISFSNGICLMIKSKD